MTNVYYTWLGPTQEATKEVPGFKEKQRPDRSGIFLSARSEFTAPDVPDPTPPPKIFPLRTKEVQAGLRS